MVCGFRKYGLGRGLGVSALVWMCLCGIGCGSNENLTDPQAESSQAADSSGNSFQYESVSYPVPVELDQESVPSPIYVQLSEQNVGKPLSQLDTAAEGSVQSVLEKIVQAVSSDDAEAMAALTDPEKTPEHGDLFPMMVRVMEGNDDPVLSHVYAVGDYRFCFLLSGNEQFPFIPLLLEKQGDRWLRNIADEQQPVFQTINSLFYCLFHQVNGFQKNAVPEEMEFVSIETPFGTESEHEFKIAWAPFCVLNAQVMPELKLDDAAAESGGESVCSQAGKAVEFYHEFWVAAGAGEKEKYTSKLSPQAKESFERFETANRAAWKENLQMRAAWDRKVNSVFVTDQMALVFFTITDRGFDRSSFQRLWKAGDGEYKLTGLDEFDSFRSFIEMDAVKETLRENGFQGL